MSGRPYGDSYDSAGGFERFVPIAKLPRGAKVTREAFNALFEQYMLTGGEVPMPLAVHILSEHMPVEGL